MPEQPTVTRRHRARRHPYLDLGEPCPYASRFGGCELDCDGEDDCRAQAQWGADQGWGADDDEEGDE